MREAPERIVRIDSARDKGEVQAQIEAALAALEARLDERARHDPRIEPAAATSTACRGWRRRCGARSRRSKLTRSSSTGRAASASSSSRWRSPRAGCARPRSPARRSAVRAMRELQAARGALASGSLVLVPEALRESLGWDLGGNEGEEAGEGGKRKPSKEIRVEAVRAAIAFATTTSARGRGKVVVVHPAERMNDVAASAFLKTLEEPAGDARFLLCSAAPDSLLPTIRSRCQQVVLPVPAAADAEAWLARQGIAQPGVLLAASGGQPQQALDFAERGIDAAAWLALPRRIAAGTRRVAGLGPGGGGRRAPEDLPRRRGARVRRRTPLLPERTCRQRADLDALLRWSRELARVAAEAEHPWSVDLAIESLVGQGREALKTPRSRAIPGKACR
jgi:DNA polymerase-3 subunit delta'